jgi:hypothetical protein
MTWRADLVGQLAAAIPCGYQRRGPPATEPTCLAAIALARSGHAKSSLQALQWLSSIQSDDGSVGPTADLHAPGWPTALAILASDYVDRSDSNDVLGLYGDRCLAGDNDPKAKQPFNVDHAVRWLIQAKGHTFERDESMGHDSTLVGWPWVIGTHSWAEPTALSVLALKSAGYDKHPRTRDATRLLHDRLLPDGGCNYGNTTVLGQELRPHIQPTGLTLLALYGETDHDGRIARSLEYLGREINGETAAASMAYGIWALARYGRALTDAPDWLAAAARRRTTRESPLRMALLLLASTALECGGLTQISHSNHVSRPIVTHFANAD